MIANTAHEKRMIQIWGGCYSMAAAHMPELRAVNGDLSVENTGYDE